TDYQYSECSSKHHKTTDFLTPMFIGINTWGIWRCHVHHHHHTKVVIQTNTRTHDDHCSKEPMLRCNRSHDHQEFTNKARSQWNTGKRQHHHSQSCSQDWTTPEQTTVICQTFCFIVVVVRARH